MPLLTVVAFARRFNDSVSTIRRCDDSKGHRKRIRRKKPFINAKNLGQRLAWARENRNQDWNTVLWTDEVRVQTGADISPENTIRNAGEAYNVQRLQSSFYSGWKTIMVWAAIAYSFKSPLSSRMVKCVKIPGVTLDRYTYSDWTL